MPEVRSSGNGKVLMDEGTDSQALSPAQQGRGAGQLACLPVFLTIEQVAQLLQVSEKSVSRWAKADPTMPALRIGRTLRFNQERLMAWLKTNTQGFGCLRTQRMAHDDAARRATV